MSWLKLSKAGTRFSRVRLPLLRSSKRHRWLSLVVVPRFSLVGREDFHGSSDALLAAHYTGYGVWMEEVYKFMN